MKKFFTLAFVAVAAMFAGNAYADETVDGSTNVVSIKVGDTDDLTKIPVTVYLNNPGVLITCVEVNMEAPVAVTKWDGYYDDDEEAYVWNYDKGTRWKSNHTATITPGTKTHGENALFISVPSSTTQSFRDEEGAIITICFDGSELADGKYSVKMFDSFSVWSDKVTNITYTSPEMEAEFTIEGGKATAVNAIEAVAAAPAKGIYTIAGQPVAEPVKGQIYVIDGQTVKY